MYRQLFKNSILIGIIFIFSSTAFAATGPASTYKVTVTKFELSSDGVNYTTVFSGTSSELDIALASGSGQAVGNFMSGLSVPDGTYTHCKVTPSATFKISGNVGTNYTKSTNGPDGGCAMGTASQQGECTITLTGGNVPTATTQNFSSTPITVTNGIANHKVRVSFDVSNGLRDITGSDTEIYPAIPLVTMSIQ